MTDSEPMASAVRSSSTNDGPELVTFPDWSLSYRFDDRDDPAKLTIYSPDSDGLATHWITIDSGAAVPIEAIR